MSAILADMTPQRTTEPERFKTAAELIEHLNAEHVPPGYLRFSREDGDLAYFRQVHAFHHNPSRVDGTQGPAGVFGA